MKNWAKNNLEMFFKNNFEMSNIRIKQITLFFHSGVSIYCVRRSIIVTHVSGYIMRHVSELHVSNMRQVSELLALGFSRKVLLCRGSDGCIYVRDTY